MCHKTRRAKLVELLKTSEDRCGSFSASVTGFLPVALVCGSFHSLHVSRADTTSRPLKRFLCDLTFCVCVCVCVCGNFIHFRVLRPLNSICFLCVCVLIIHIFCFLP